MLALLDLPVVAPVHLSGADAIAAAFKVRREEVLTWPGKGAPIAQDPRTGRYDGEYNAIQAWRVRVFQAKKSE